MLILGLTKTTLLDYPGKVAATVFTGGCNFRCPFCHNGHLVLNVANEQKIYTEEVMEHLTKRRNVLEGVCITGGEPTIQSDLPEFIGMIKDLGYDIKLDTNGSNPKMLRELISDGLISYVAMDIKNSKEKYAFTTGCTETDLTRIEESIQILKEGTIPYEFRTTVVRQLHEPEDIVKISNWIGDETGWYIQSYKDSDYVIQSGFSAYSKEELESMLSRIKNINCSLRGVE